MTDTNSDNGLTVILGWDGLDHELATKFGVADSFGPHHKEIDTFDNPVLGTPHTLELWPSIISGATPEEHGIWAASENSGVEWENPVLNRASTLAQGVVPANIREKIGLILRDSGANVQHKDSEFYAKRGIETVFDGRNSLSLAIPNYHTEQTERLDLVVDRGADLADFLQIDTEDGKTIHRPKVPLHEYEARLVSEASKKLGLVRAAIEREYDIVFVWLGIIDSVGHIAPVAGEKGDGWQERSYHLAAQWTTQIRETLTSEDTLVCVSDHGLRNGDHTHEPFFGSTNSSVVSEVDSVLDVADAIDHVTPSHPDGKPTVRDHFRRETAAEEQDASAVRDHLKDLGYL